MNRGLLVSGFVVLVLALSCGAWADFITVVNPSFEQPGVGRDVTMDQVPD